MCIALYGAKCMTLSIAITSHNVPYHYDFKGSTRITLAIKLQTILEQLKLKLQIAYNGFCALSQIQANKDRISFPISPVGLHFHMLVRS